MGYKQKTKKMMEEVQDLIKELHELEGWYAAIQEKRKVEKLKTKEKAK